MSFEEHAFAGAEDRRLIRANYEKNARITNEIELKGGKFLEICRTSFDHLPRGVG